MGNFTYRGSQGVSSIDYVICDQSDPKPLEQLPTHFIWDQSSPSMFKFALDSPDTRDLENDFLNHDFEETQFGVDIAVQKFQNILLNAAKRSLKRKVKKRRCR